MLIYVKNYVEWKEIENMLRVIEAFSGIGAQKQALLDSGIEHEIIKGTSNNYQLIHL